MKRKPSLVALKGLAAALAKNGAVGLRPIPNGAELVISAKERRKQPTRAVEQPELTFDMVGNFEPSFSEYVTDYLLSEVWLPGADGVVVLTTSGKHEHRTVTGRGQHQADER